jgi:hypothetical protein
VEAHHTPVPALIVSEALPHMRDSATAQASTGFNR